jgi:hypothetical protein
VHKIRRPVDRIDTPQSFFRARPNRLLFCLGHFFTQHRNIANRLQLADERGLRCNIRIGTQTAIAFMLVRHLEITRHDFFCCNQFNGGNGCPEQGTHTKRTCFRQNVLFHYSVFHLIEQPMLAICS